MKRAQGLSFSVIVLAIIAFLILVLIITWATGTFGKITLRTKHVTEATETQIAAAQSKCSRLCIQAQALTDPDKWSNSAYCRHKEAMDLDGDGTITDEENNEGLGKPCMPDGDEFLCCWEEPIYQYCEARIGDKVYTHEEC